MRTTVDSRYLLIDFIDVSWVLFTFIQNKSKVGLKNCQFSFKYVLLITGLLLSYNSFTQKPNFKFSHHNIEDGLIQSSANAMLQDSNDYLWIGTFGGLSRFDGYEFVSFESNISDSTSLADNAIWALFEDSKGSIWIGTKNSLTKYIQSSNSFKNYYLSDNIETTLAVKVIFETSDQRLLVGTEGKGVYEYDYTTDILKPDTRFPNDVKVTSICEDQDQSLWMTTEQNGVFKSSSTSVNALEVQITPREYSFKAMLLDNRGGLWLGSNSKGLFYKSPDNDQFQQIDLGESNLQINAIAQDNLEQIWIGTLSSGLLIYDLESKVVHLYQKDLLLPSVAHNNVTNIIIGNSGNVFVGYYLKGFDILTESPFEVYRHNPLDKSSLSHDNVYSLYYDSSGQLWVGTFGGGLNLLLEDGTFQKWKHDENDLTSISHDWVRFMLRDSQNRFWIGTWGGGLNIKYGDNEFKSYFHDPNDPASISMNTITYVHEDSKGEIWIGTYGEGINVYQPTTDDFRHIRYNSQDPNSISSNHITSVYEDDEGIKWIGTYGGGLNRFDTQTGHFKAFTPIPGDSSSIGDYKVLYCFPGQDTDHLWVTTLGGGLNLFNKKSGKFIRFTKENGLPNNNVMGMLRDGQDQLWFSTNYGISHFNPNTLQFKNYNIEDGLSSVDMGLMAYAKDEIGKMYFGGKNGLMAFYPQDIKAKQFFPKLAISQITVEGQDQNTQLDDIAFGKRIEFHFTAVNPVKPNSIQYAYSLQGWTDGWIDIGKQKQLAFSALSPGNYTLKIKSSNGSGQWNDSFVETSFKIQPPWYRTWTFRILAALAIIAIAVLYYLYKIKEYKEQRKLLVKKVAQRTATIQLKNRDLEVAYQKQKEMETFKEKMIHLIAHDLKNPLVTILNRSEHSDLSARMQTQKSGQTMLRLVENMLEVQKLQKTDLQIKKTNIRLNDLFREALSELELFAKDKRITMKMAVDQEIEVKADFELLNRVITNLLSNAIKYTNAGGEVILGQNVHGNQIEIYVKDNGIGLAEEDKNRIFEAYEQSSVASLGGSKSTGLGLTFCKLAVEAHQSQLKIASKLGEGSKFYFNLLIEKSSSISHQASSTQSVNGQLPSLSKESIEYLLLFKEVLSKLSIYETGAWYAQIKSIQKIQSEEISKWTYLLKERVSNFDQEGVSALLNQLKPEHRQQD